MLNLQYSRDSVTFDLISSDGLTSVFAALPRQGLGQRSYRMRSPFRQNTLTQGVVSTSLLARCVPWPWGQAREVVLRMSFNNNNNGIYKEYIRNIHKYL